MSRTYDPADCAERASQTLYHHKGISRHRIASEGDLVDILTDLAHLAHRQGWDFAEAVHAATINEADERQPAA